MLLKTFLRKIAIMKQDLDKSKVYLDNEELNVLVKEVKETVVVNIGKEHVFSVADLWRIRRMHNRTQVRSTIWN
jgi:hypothetical protein